MTKSERAVVRAAMQAFDESIKRYGSVEASLAASYTISGRKLIKAIARLAKRKRRGKDK